MLVLESIDVLDLFVASVLIVVSLLVDTRPPDIS